MRTERTATSFSTSNSSPSLVESLTLDPLSEGTRCLCQLTAARTMARARGPCDNVGGWSTRPLPPARTDSPRRQDGWAREGRLELT